MGAPTSDLPRWITSKGYWLLIAIVLLGDVHPTYCQDNPLTSKQTNQQIFNLARNNAPAPSEITIGSGDVLHIDVFDVQELSREVRVSDTGDISLPLIPGRIHVAGLTTFELEAKLENLLLENGLVSHPQVSVFVREQISQPVSVMGAVAKPGIQQIVRPTTLLEVLANAGGITDEAGSVVQVTRGGLNSPSPETATPTSKGDGQDSADEQGQTQTIRLRNLLVSGDPTFNIPIHGGDVVSVPRTAIVYVIGAVQGPGGYALESRGEEITVLKVVTLAHGLTSTAKGNSALIVRQDPATGAKQQIPAPVNKILARKMDDIRLRGGDMLYVPDSTGKKALYKFGAFATIVGTSLVIYHLP